MTSKVKADVSQADSSSADNSINQFHAFDVDSTADEKDLPGNNEESNKNSEQFSPDSQANVVAIKDPLEKEKSAKAPQLGFAKRVSLFENGGTDSANWNEQDQIKKRRTHPLVQGLIYGMVVIGSFLIFLYLTFPYGVIKEVVVSSMTENFRKSGLPVRVAIGSLQPHWLTGLKLQNVSITNITDTNAVLTLTEVTARVNILPIFIGKIVAKVQVMQSQGSLNLSAELPFFTLVRGQLSSPSFAKAEFKNFSLEPLINHALAYARASKDPGMVLVLPLLARTTGGGALSGELSMENADPSHLGKAKGNMQVQLAKAFFHIDDSTLKIPRQTFNDARIDLGFANNSLEFKNMKLKAEDIGIGITGRVALADLPGSTAQADLNFELTMHGEIEKNLGFIVPNMMRCKPLVQGELKAKLTGPLGQMNCE